MCVLGIINSLDANKQKEFVKWLLKIGENYISTIAELEENTIQLLKDIILPFQEINNLIYFVYNYLLLYYNSQYLIEREIFTPKNEYVKTINDIIIDQFFGEVVKYLSANEIEQTESVNRNRSKNLYPTEFLDFLNFGRLFSHQLILKVGVPIMLLCNINLSKSLYNRIRLICHSLQKHVIEAEIITGKYTGTCVFLFHLILLSSNIDLLFILKCRQFPVQPAFAITINKS